MKSFWQIIYDKQKSHFCASKVGRFFLVNAVWNEIICFFKKNFDSCKKYGKCTFYDICHNGLEVD